jgi:methylphosphotriester-DNA--protein-cysteine methyltransferase
MNLVDNVMFLPEAGSKTFWLNGSAWEFPTFENVETFVNRLVREEILVRDPVVGAVLCDQPPALSFSTIRRRFLQVTGLTPGKVRQIERARKAATLLAQGASILDTVDKAGYFDQPHLTRSLKHFMGQTPAQIARAASIS